MAPFIHSPAVIHIYKICILPDLATSGLMPTPSFTAYKFFLQSSPKAVINLSPSKSGKSLSVDHKSEIQTFWEQNGRLFATLNIFTQKQKICRKPRRFTNMIFC